MNQALLHDSFEYNLQDQADCQSLEQLPSSFPGHASSSFENEGDSSAPTVFRSSGTGQLNHSSVHPLSLHTTGSFDYRASATHASSDLSFQPGSSVPMSTTTSSRGSSSTSPNSGCSSFAFQPQHSQYAVNNNASYNLASQSAPPNYSPASYSQNFLHSPLEVRPRLTSIPLISGMPPPSRHSVNPIPVSPPLGSSLRNDYSSSPAHVTRHAFPSHSNPFHLSPSPQSPLSAMSRSLDSASGRGSPASTAHFSFTSPMQIEVGSHLGANPQQVPPFDNTESFFQLTDESGRTPVQPEIHAKIDKGFFRADQDWTCYRRNYFSVACSYGLSPTRNDLDYERVFLIRQGSPERILGFYMCIAAKVDGEDGKPIELVQHTPKRDKGPMTQPEKKELKPNPSGNLGMYASTAGFGPSQSLTGEYEASSYLGNPQDSQSVATFERIQFKKATANNGKRRAAQQYFHIVVELFAKVYKGKGNETEFVKIAHRVSAQMVVRGRSPGHYQDERRSSSTNMGPGSGSGGDFGATQRDPGSAGSSLGSHSSLGGAHYTTRLGPGAYQTHHSSIAYSSSVAASLPPTVPSNLTGSFDHFVEPLPCSEMTVEERTNMEDNHVFQYYPNTSYESQSSVTRASAGPLSLATSTTAPTGYENSASYAGVTSIKEEPSSKSSSKTEEHHRLGSGFDSLPLPAVGKWLNHHDPIQPPRDCRPMQMDTHRVFYTATPAAW